jgi:phospholipase C
MSGIAIADIQPKPSSIPQFPLEERMAINRRDFLRSVAGVASTAAIPGAVHRVRGDSQAALPAPEDSGINHIVVVMMENRSFDHLLGWLPGGNGHQAGLTYIDSNWEAHPTNRLTTFVGCSHPDPDHSYAGGRSEVNNGAMDGWLQTTTNDTFSIGYYLEEDLPFFAALARNFTTLDNYFASILGRRFRIAFSSMRLRPIAPRTRSISRRCRRFGIGSRHRV